jgi:GNAT superfamily N-acetyltransferase
VTLSWSHTVETAAGPLECVPLTGDRFSDMETVFGEKGTARKCFCMYWRRPDGGFADDRNNRDRFAEIAAEGPPPGLLGYIESDPRGWVQVGPRPDFPALNRSRLLKPVDKLEPWTINCFVVRTGERRQGIGKGLLIAAIEYAKSQGAKVIEAYPVDGARESAVDYFTGTLSMFADHGFVEVIRRNETRPIVRLTV